MNKRSETSGQTQISRAEATYRQIPVRQSSHYYHPVVGTQTNTETAQTGVKWWGFRLVLVETQRRGIVYCQVPTRLTCDSTIKEDEAASFWHEDKARETYMMTKRKTTREHKNT
jgi:hypothetical protein